MTLAIGLIGLDQVVTAGFAREDGSAVIKIFPGITLPSPKDKDQS